MKRRKQLQRSLSGKNNSIVNRYIPGVILTRKSVIVTTAFSIFFGICAYYYKAHLISVGIR